FLAGANISVFEKGPATSGQYVLRYSQLVLQPSVAVVITLTAPATTSGASRAVYTSGGVLESTAYPPVTHACTHQNRIIMIPADERDKIYYTQKQIFGEVPSFND